jgi:hypothetical protein
MDDLPDVQEVAIIVAAIEARGADTGAQQLDRDHQVLLDEQAEIAELVSRELPAEYKKDEVRALLDRIENAIDDNRAKRKALSR